MTDVIDQACEQAEFFLASALSEQAKKPSLRATGQCLNCDEVVAVGLFCDADCRDDFERIAKSAALNKG